MALGKNGNSKNSTSYKPYDASNSFVMKVKNCVTDLIGWRPSNYECNEDQNHEDFASGFVNDDETVSPTPKRIKFTPKTVSNDGCSSIQPINDFHVAGPSFKNQCMASSTPAPIPNFGARNAGNVADYLDSSAPSNISLTLPSISSHHRHNATIPGVRHKEIPSSTSYNLNKSLNESSALMDQRRPSFDAEVFSASSKRLSLSMCESRSRSCLSPFYSARTMYGGASALLPYSTLSGAGNRLRAESTSKMNIFSPKNQITIQPIPSPQRGVNDQETMSAAARRILDTLEKYCSPVKDAKRIPINEFSARPEDSCKPFTPRGVKRKLPALTQMIPSTTDLLRIKRQEKMQDSVLSARQLVSSVPETSTAGTDSDSSSDSADLDYAVFTENTNEKDDSRQYVRKIKRKYESKIDDKPLKPVNLPNAVLKITNLPKFNITDSFTFSKPLLLENLDKVGVEDAKPTAVSGSVATAGTAVTYAAKSSNRRVESADETNISLHRSPAVRSVVSKADVFETVKPFVSSSMKTRIGSIVRDTNVSSTKSKLSFFDKSSNVANIIPWNCKKCLLENSGEQCSSCSNSRPSASSHVQCNEQKKSQEDISKNPSSCEREEKSVRVSYEGFSLSSKESTNVGSVVLANNSVDGNGDRVNESKVGSDQDGSTVICNHVAVVEENVDDKLNVSSNPSELWKNLVKNANDTWKCDDCWIMNKKSHSKCAACGASNKLLPATGAEEKKTEVSKPTFTFGIGKSECNLNPAANCVNFASDSKLGTGFTFGFVGVNANCATTSATSVVDANVKFSFGNANANSIATSVRTNDQNEVKQASTPSFTFGSSKLETGSTPIGSAAVKDSPCFHASTEASKISHVADKPFVNKTSEAATFNDVSSSTSNKKKLFFKQLTDPGSENVVKSSKPVAQQNNTTNAGNGPDPTASTPNDISSSTEIPNKKKTVTFSSLFNKDVTNSTNVFGANGLPENDFKLPSTNNVTAVSSSSNVLASNFSSSTSIPVIANSKMNDAQFSTFVSGTVSHSFNDGSNAGSNDSNLSSSVGGGGSISRPAVAIATLASTFGDSGTFKNAIVPTDPNKSSGLFSGIINSSNSINNNNGNSNNNANTNHFDVSSSQPSNSVFVNFGSIDRNTSKISESSSTIAPLLAVPTTLSFNASATPFRFGISASTNTQTTGGFAFNGPKLDNTAPKFGFGTSNNAFGTVNSAFSFNSSALTTTSAENSLAGGSVFSSSKMPLCDGQLSMTKSPSSFGGANIFANSVPDSVKKSGGFSFGAPNQVAAPTLNNFSSFGASVNDNQDQNRSNNSNTAPSTPFVFGSSSNQAVQSHNFSLTVPQTFNFTGSSSIPSFTAQPATATTSAPGSRKIKKAVRRTNNK